MHSYKGIIRYLFGRRVKPKSLSELAMKLRTPHAIYRYIRRNIRVMDGGPEMPEKVLETGTASQRGVARFAAELLHRLGYPTYIMYVGHKLGKLYPFAITFADGYAISIGEVMRFHAPDPFEIMRDYYPDGNRWVIVDIGLNTVLASYSSGRQYEVFVNLESPEMQKIVFGAKSIYQQ